MNVLLGAAVACLVAGLLWLNLDSGRLAAPAPPVTSLPLLGLAAIFAGGAWASTRAGMPRRTPLLAGLAAGVGGYALLRLVAF